MSQHDEGKGGAVAWAVYAADIHDRPIYTSASHEWAEDKARAWNTVPGESERGRPYRVVPLYPAPPASREERCPECVKDDERQLDRDGCYHGWKPASPPGFAEGIEKAARAFLAKLELCEEALLGIYASAAVHGVPYNGPNYVNEKNALIRALQVKGGE